MKVWSEMGREGPSPNGMRDIENLVERWERAAQPITLPNSLVARTGPRRTGDPVKVRAVIPVYYSYSDVLAAECEVIEWTKSAVKIRVVIPPSTTPREIWVWASAVERMG